MDPRLKVTTERIDDIVLLLPTMMRLELPAIRDRHLPRHWLQQGLSWGWVATSWLAHILSQGDPRKLPVRAWVGQTRETLERVTGQKIRDTDFTDDWLTIVLREVSQPASWHGIEQTLGQRTLRVYALPQQRVRLDAPTVSGYHTGGEESLFQFGKSKDDPTLRQVKVRLGTLDPLGLPLAMEVVSGEQADDGLYVPLINRMRPLLPSAGWLFVGDCKLSGLATRAHIHHMGHHYLTPLALVGETASAMPGWIQAAVAGTEPLTPITTLDDKGEEVILGHGYETTRT